MNSKKQKPISKEKIKEVLQSAILKRNNTFTQKSIDIDFQYLVEKEILVTSDKSNYYYINFKLFRVCEVLLEIAEEKLNQPLPDTPLIAIQYLERFFSEIRMPEPRTYWYGVGNLEHNLRKYVISSFGQFFSNNLDILIALAKVQNGNERNKAKFLFTQAISKCLPSFPLTSEQVYKFVTELLYDGHKERDILESVFEITSKDYDIGMKLLKMVESDSAIEKYPFLMGRILLGLFTHNPILAFDKSLKLLNSPIAEIEAINTIGWFNYKKAEQIIAAIMAIDIHTSGNIDYIATLPRFYGKILSSHSSLLDKNLVKFCFGKLSELFEHEDNKVVEVVKRWIRLIDGFEEIRISYLFKEIDKGYKPDLTDFFRNFKNQKYLFDLGCTNKEKKFPVFLSCETNKKNRERVRRTS